MKTVAIQASRSYDVLIGSGLQSQLGTYAATLTKPGKAALISDSNVWPLYGQNAEQRLQEQGFSVCSFVFIPYYALGREKMHAEQI